MPAETSRRLRERHPPRARLPTRASPEPWPPRHRSPASGAVPTLPAVHREVAGRILSRVAASRRRSFVLVALVAAVPRLVVLVAERGTVLQPFTLGEKSDDIARTFLASGTFGFIPGHPSAYTQPLYSYFLIGLYLTVDRSWEVVGGAQVVVAALTAMLVYEIGRRHIAAVPGLLAALIVAVHPYSLWHDVHVNREILDGLLAVAITLFALELLERRTFRLAAILGATYGLSILGNVRLAVLPLLIGCVCLVAWKPTRRTFAVVAVSLAVCVVVLAPWVIRNRVQVGCFAITTDSRALWEANNPETYPILRRGSWIDNVPVPTSFPPSAQDAGRLYRRHGRIESVDECAQVSFYQD